MIGGCAPYLVAIGTAIRTAAIWSLFSPRLSIPAEFQGARLVASKFKIFKVAALGDATRIHGNRMPLMVANVRQVRPVP